MEKTLVTFKKSNELINILIVGTQFFYKNIPSPVINNHAICGILYNQVLIGWNYFVHGCISQDLLQYMNQMYRNCLPKYIIFTGNRQAKKVIVTVLSIRLDEQSTHCRNFYNSSSPIFLSNETQSCLTTVQLLCNKSITLSIIKQKWFELPIKEYKNWTTRNLETWIMHTQFYSKVRNHTRQEIEILEICYD